MWRLLTMSVTAAITISVERATVLRAGGLEEDGHRRLSTPCSGSAASRARRASILTAAS